MSRACLQTPVLLRPTIHDVTENRSRCGIRARLPSKFWVVMLEIPGIGGKDCRRCWPTPRIVPPAESPDSQTPSKPEAP